MSDKCADIAYEFLISHIESTFAGVTSEAMREERARDYHSAVVCVPIFTADLGRTTANIKYPSHVKVCTRTRECTFEYANHTHDYTRYSYFNLAGMLSWNKTIERLRTSFEPMGFSLYSSIRRDLSSICVQWFPRAHITIAE